MVRIGKYAAIATMVIAAGYTVTIFSGSRMAGAGDIPRGLSCGRIISLAPSITEMVFALGLGEKIVGVTRYCDFPADALKIPKVGGLHNPNYEAIVVLRPSLVIAPPHYEGTAANLHSLDIDTLTVKYETIGQILDTIKTIAGVCGAEDKAEEIVSSLKSRIDKIAKLTKGLKTPRVLVSVDRDLGADYVKDAHFAGKGNFYDDMIALAGGVNAFTGVALGYPRITSEGILDLNPDIIIEMVPQLALTGLDESVVKRRWRSLSEVEAVKNGRIYVFSEKYTVIPGPRFILILERLAKLFHPEIKWN